MQEFDYAQKQAEDPLNKHENRNLRRTTGQLNWFATQTRPDLSYDSLSLSMILNKATHKDAKHSLKVVEKAKEDHVKLKFTHLGDIENLHIEVFADASLGGKEKDFQTKSVMGLFIGLSNEKLDINPLHWKSKVIDKVAEDIKTAETLALEASIDDAIYLSDMITEVYTGQSKSDKIIPLVINEDSISLIQSLYSTKKVKRKAVRVVILYPVFSNTSKTKEYRIYFMFVLRTK